MPVEDEKAWFDKNRAFIAQHYNGQYVLVKDKAIRGAYPDWASAYKAGVQQFGPNGQFFVEQALPQEKVHTGLA
jgi:hypothetical protein